MRASCSSSSYKYNPRHDTNLTNRLKTIFKKTYQLSILCETELCFIYYGPDGKLTTWPEEREKVEDIALRYQAATKRKKSVTLHEFLEDEKKKHPKKRKRESEYPTWYPIFDHCSPDQLSELTLSLQHALFNLLERARVIEAQKQKNTNPLHQPQTQPLNPNQLYATLSQLPLANYQLYGLDHNITNTNFQQPCFSNPQQQNGSSQQQSAVNNYLSEIENILMQPDDLYGFDHNITNPQQQDGSSEQQSAVNNYLLEIENILMQPHDLYAFDHNITNPQAQDGSSEQQPAVNNYLLEIENILMQPHDLYAFDHNITNPQAQDGSSEQQPADLFKNNLMQPHDLYGFGIPINC